MERRDLLKAGAVLAVSGSGCATLSATEGNSLASFLQTLDAALEAISTRPLFDAFRIPGRPDLDVAVTSRDALMRKTFRSLTLAGALGDLTPEERTHPEVARRVSASLGEIDDAMFGMTEVLENLTTTERAQVGKALRDDPQLGMRILGEVDREAASLGLSSGVRLRLRNASAQVTSRLRLSPDLTIGEYTTKFRKLEARHGARAEAERAFAASTGASMIWAAEGGGSGGALPSSMRKCVETSECEANEECGGYVELRPGEWTLGTCTVPPGGKRTRKRSPGFLSTGAIALGIGLPVGIASLASGLGVASLLVATFGGLLALSGLVVLIIGIGIAAGGE
ncbi:MAG: hypothetical protein JNM17_13450 [Archangium sp.]|nr:hypothetical protein [Archangium sp.]